MGIQTLAKANSLCRNLKPTENNERKKTKRPKSTSRTIQPLVKAFQNLFGFLFAQRRQKTTKARLVGRNKKPQY